MADGFCDNKDAWIGR